MSEGARPFLDADFPGYAEAVQRENVVRGAACLGLNEKICGLEVRPLTAAHVRWLVLVKSPFLIRGISPEQMAAKPDIYEDVMKFLWIVSPMFRAGSRPAPRWKRIVCGWALFRLFENPRDKFNRIFSPILQNRIDIVCREILEYFDEAWLDAGEPGTSDKTYFVFEVEIAHELHEHYGFRVDFWNRIPDVQNPIMVPLKLVFQFRKMRHRREGIVLTNASERFISAGLALMNERDRNLADYERGLKTQPAPENKERIEPFELN